ncbi:DinB family protein [Candidatus Acetothermia bacterium]|nr:DinB family protein [Candidatus Acetothermia bacterium]
MAATINDLVELLRHTRKHFLKHLNGLKDEQWDWKPYPECKSIRETLAHLIADDRAALQSLQTGKEPTYETLQESERDLTKLLALLDKSHQELCEFLLKKYANAPLDTEVCVWGTKTKMARGIPYFLSEDFYHAGQVAFIRMATDPKWDYYAAIYGGQG